jgi:hypothetical protein
LELQGNDAEPAYGREHVRAVIWLPAASEVEI